MLSFAIRRILQTVPTVLAVVMVIFVLFSVVPGSIVSSMSDDGRGPADPQVVEHDPGPSERHVPVVGLVQVVVQADDATGLTVGAVRLDHLAPLRDPRPAVRLDEAAALVTGPAVTASNLVSTASMLAEMSRAGSPNCCSQMWPPRITTSAISQGIAPPPAPRALK